MQNGGRALRTRGVARYLALTCGLCGFPAAVLGCTASLDFDALSVGDRTRDGLDGAADGTAASPAADGGSTDASADAGSLADVSEPNDANGDAADSSAPEAAVRFCKTVAPTPTFCDDFDDPAHPTVWDFTQQENGTIAVDTVAHVSAPSSLLSNIAAVNLGSNVIAAKQETFPAARDAAATFRFSFDMRVDQFDGANDAEIVPFELVFGTTTNFDQIVMNLDGLNGAFIARFAENSQNGATPDGYVAHSGFAAQPTKGTWMNVRVEVDAPTPHGTANNKLRVFFDDASMYDGALDVALKGDTPRVQLGIGYAHLPNKAWSVRFDNFVATVTNL